MLKQSFYQNNVYAKDLTWLYISKKTYAWGFEYYKSFKFLNILLLVLFLYLLSLYLFDFIHYYKTLYFFEKFEHLNKKVIYDELHNN